MSQSFFNACDFAPDFFSLLARGVHPKLGSDFISIAAGPASRFPQEILETFCHANLAPLLQQESSFLLKDQLQGFLKANRGGLWQKLSAVSFTEPAVTPGWRKFFERVARGSVKVCPGPY